MNTLTAYLAWKFLWFKGKDKNIAFMIKICFLSIFIGTFALMLTLIIMNGFEKTIHEKMQGINASIIISSPGNRLDYDQLRTMLKKEFPTLIHEISAACIKQAILDHNNLQSVVFFKGIDVDHEEEVSTLAQKITWPTYKKNTALLQKLVHENTIIIGYKMAQENHLKVGDTITILIPEPGSSKKIFLNKKSFIIGGIFRIGLEEYDNNFAFIDLEYLNQIFDEHGVDQVTVRLKNTSPATSIYVNSYQDVCSRHWWKQFFINITTRIIRFFKSEDSDKAALQKIAQRLPHLSVNSWKDLYPALVSSLKLEKYVMFFILALITLVASMNMISLLFMQIQHKLRDIAIFKTMGLANNAIKNIFLWSGISITLLASLAGLGCAAGAGYLLEKYPFIQLPDVYYISYLPARMDADIFLAVFCATMLLGFLATWIPAQRTKYINIAHVLRQE